MDLEIIILSKVSQRERQILYDITCMWNLKQDTSEHTYETERNRHTEQTCGCQGEEKLGEGLGVRD